MIYDPSVYGYQPESLFTNKEIVIQRLHDILTDKVLIFNPYRVPDGILLDCMERARWRPFPAITQMVVFHFHQIVTHKLKYSYDAISFSIGNDPTELSIPVNVLSSWLTDVSSLTQVHVTINGHPITNAKTVEKMQGKDFFVSHAIMAQTPNGKRRPAYRMVRLSGNKHQKAYIVRTAMIQSKISMLRQIISHPYSPEFLKCSRAFIDYTSPIINAINIIKNYPIQSPNE
ncbi:MAG: hypothetical protein NC328_08085 [Muribaculum sp.]|nr:hypothetical protein [Muribaculum sp.]